MYIEIKGLKKTYGQGTGQTQALRGVDLEVEKGEVVVILGQSGGGKSTLLNIIGGLESPSGGVIKVNGETINRYTPEQLAQYRKTYLGFVFQHYNLVGDLTVEENVELCQSLSENPLKMGELLQVLGMAKLRNRFPAELSGGQQQRTAIARALIKNPPILLCDEPTGALDTNTSKDILILLEKINKLYGTTILMVTHAPAIAGMAHRVIKVRDGQVIETIIHENPLAAKDIEL